MEKESESDLCLPAPRDAFVDIAALVAAALACGDDADALIALARLLWEAGARGLEAPEAGSTAVDRDERTAPAARAFVTTACAAADSTAARFDVAKIGGDETDQRAHAIDRD